MSSYRADPGERRGIPKTTDVPRLLLPLQPQCESHRPPLPSTVQQNMKWQRRRAKKKGHPLKSQVSSAFSSIHQASNGHMHKSHSRRQRDGERGNTGSCALPAATGVGSGISEKEPEPKFEHGKGRAARVNALIPRQARPCRMHFNCDSHPCAQGDAVEQKARIPPLRSAAGGAAGTSLCADLPEVSGFQWPGGSRGPRGSGHVPPASPSDATIRSALSSPAWVARCPVECTQALSHQRAFQLVELDLGWCKPAHPLQRWTVL